MLTLPMLTLREDAYRAKTEDGSSVLTHRGVVSLTGASVHEWIERLAPYLDGRHTLAELTASLAPRRREFVEDLVAALLKGEVIRELDAEQAPGSDNGEVSAHRGEIAFIGYFRDRAARVFQHYRQGTTLVVGSGPLLPAVLRASLLSGRRRVRGAVTDPHGVDPHGTDLHGVDLHAVDLHSVASDEQLADMVGEADLVVHVADRPVPRRARLFDRLCAQRGVPVCQAVIVGGAAWLSGPVRPGLDAHGFSDGWRRLTALSPVGHGGSPPSPVVVANRLVHSAFRYTTDTATNTATAGPELVRPELVRIEAETLRSTTHRFVAHPFSDDAAPEDETEFRRRIGEVERGPRLDPQEFSRSAAALSDSRLGVFGEISEDDLAQLPLLVTRTTVSDPVGLLGEDTARPVAIGAGLDFADTRYRAALRALAVYGALMVDPRRLCTATGEPLLAPGADPDTGLARLRSGELRGHVRALELAAHRCCLLPAEQAFPALRDPGTVPVGVAAAYSWSEVVETGLIAHCRQITRTEAATVPGPFALIELAGWGELDEVTQRCLRMVAALDDRVDVYDVTGRLGVPTFACCLAGRTVAYGCASTTSGALLDGVRQLLLAYQARVNDEPLYAPASVPDLPRPLRGTRMRPRQPRVPLDVAQLVSALAEHGHRPRVVPLDHDRKVHQVMPYLAHVVVSHDGH
jgi:hypothetical protein